VLRPSLPSQIRLSVTLQDEDAFLLSGEGQIEQILLNLGLNASEAMPAGGELQLDIHRHPSDDSTLEIVVSDQGAGIPPSVLPHIFDPFFTTKSSRGGHGLGLAAVHALVQQLKGKVSVQSVPEQGTKFIIHLPECAAPESEIPAAPASRPQRLRILVVDDQESVLQSVVQGLQDRGHEVLATTSATKALTAVAQWRPTLVITDLSMPVMTGLDLRQELLRRYPGLPILLMTGRAIEGLEKHGLGPAEVLAKPFDGLQLHEAIARLLAQTPPLSERANSLD
jgi:two-component system cell cycle sensor histidine kinase/response regulator CckA